MEAARYGCQILHGPNIWNFKEVYSLLQIHKVSNKIINAKQLERNINQMLNNKKNYKDLKLRIRKIGIKILNNTINELNFYINK